MMPEFVDAAAPSSPVAAKGKRHPAIGAMKGMIKIIPGVDLTEPADPEWVKRLHDERD